MTDVDDVIMSYELDRKNLMSAFFADDDISSIMRCYSEADVAANHVLSKLAHKGFEPKESKLRYLSEKLEVAELLGVHTNFIAPLRAHNKHRNKFAHGNQRLIKGTQLDELHQLVRKAVPVFGDDFRFRLERGDYFESPYSQLTPRQKYVGNMMMAISSFAVVPDLKPKVATLVAHGMIAGLTVSTLLSSGFCSAPRSNPVASCKSQPARQFAR